MKILGVIPARFASTRFPGKPLVDIQGITMIQRVYEQAKKCKSLARVVVATDDIRIVEHVKSFGGEVLMTNPTHQSGTDRCSEVVERLNFEIQTRHLNATNTTITFDKISPTHEGIFTAVINIQGDEPFIQPEQIEKVVDILKRGNLTIKSNKSGDKLAQIPNSGDATLREFGIATLVKHIDNQEDIDSPNIVKVIFGTDKNALYFSRSPIPFIRNSDRNDWSKQYRFFKHIGLYGYTTSTLLNIAKLPPSHLECAESLEQLRWLENGYTIGVAETDLETIGIDTPEDLKKIVI
jgi:3-deoxy-manno-octulosonate cytidylyltransferase (CMP-KDO synthetase)